MRLLPRPLAAIAAAVIAIALVGCSSTAAPADGPAATTVTITDNHGEIQVPVNPTRVVALDNHVFATLDAWGVPLAAAPKGVMGKLWPGYTHNDKVLDVGTHNEPNFEAVVEAQPQLIIGGYRFAKHYDELKKQNPQAVVIEIAPRKDQDLHDELKRTTEILGKIFAKDAEAGRLNTAYDASIAKAKAAYNGTDTAMGLITGGGKISYAAPVTGRSVGPVFPALGLKPAIEAGTADAPHGDEISVEAIASAKADWLIVLDRDAAVGEAGKASAADLLEKSAALQSVPAIQKKQIVYLDPNFYITEDIQAYTGLYTSIAEKFEAAK